MKKGITFGAFDLFHAGHVLMLKEAKTVCDYLIVALQTDPSLDRDTKNSPVQSIEEREEAMNTFKKFKEMVDDKEDLFMSGDKPHPYLDSAHKATENLIKMISASHKLLELDSI